MALAQQLEQTLVLLRSEHERFEQAQTAAKTYFTKYERSVTVQRHLEDEIVARDREIADLKEQSRIQRKSKHDIETELAQQTADFINGQSRYLDTITQLNDEVANLRQQKEDLTSQLAKANSAAQLAKQRAVSVGAMKEMKPIRADNVQAAADELEHHQNTVLIKELLARHESISEEISQVRQVNTRLQEENENFQYLLVEQTISDTVNMIGDISAQSSSSQFSGSSEIMIQTLEADISDRGECETAQKNIPSEVDKLKFEIQSLTNYNKALRVSLERLVHRLLDDKSFSSVIEESLSARTINKFNSRVASSYEAQRRLSMVSPGVVRNDPNLVSSMIFNAQFTGNASRRAVSLGVDSEKPPSSSGSSIVLRWPSGTRPRSGNSSRSASGSTAGSTLSRSTTPTEEDWIIELPKRVNSQKGLRKLQLSD